MSSRPETFTGIPGKPGPESAWEVPESTTFVAARSRQVQINREAIQAFCRSLAATPVSLPAWDTRYHFLGTEEETCAYLFLLDTLNFCFWAPRGAARWRFEYQGQTLDGYYALAAALKTAMEAGIPLADASFLAGLDMQGLTRILGGRGSLQLMHERLEAVREAGRLLEAHYQGRAGRLVRSAGQSALSLVRLLAGRLASFRDTAVYEDRAVFFYKRAQIFAADLHSALGGHGLGAFRDIGRLTAFADYKLPQVLRRQQILVYSEGLSKRIDRMDPIPPGSHEEVEIRACTIQAVEFIRRCLEQDGGQATSSQIDWLLWSMGQNDRFRESPYHRTRTIFY